MDSIRSPFQLKELAFQTRFAAEVLKAYNALMSSMPQVKATVDEARAISNEARAQLSRIHKLPKGEKGDSIRGPQGIPGKKGEDGYTPVKGKDYFTDAEIREVAEMASVLVLTPEDGKDAEVDYDLLVEKTIEVLKEKSFFKDEFDGIRNEVASYRSQLAGKVYGKDTWVRGGGDTVSAGSGVTITEDQTTGTKVISALSSSSTPLTPTGTVNAVNAVFGVTAEPTSVVSDGITYFDGAGYTYAALTITMDIPPSTYIRYYV